MRNSVTDVGPGAHIRYEAAARGLPRPGETERYSMANEVETETATDTETGTEAATVTETKTAAILGL